MLRRSPRFAALALPLLLVAGACGDDDGDAGGETTTTPPVETTTTVGDTTSAPPSTEATTTTTEPAGNVIEVEVVGGQPVGGSRDVDVPGGEEVTLRFTSDTVDEVHVHGYDLYVDIGPEGPGEVTFVADIPGQWEVELHDSGALVLNLRVR